MTLDEAIEHAKTVSLENQKSGCYDCADLHKQLELWLKELKKRRETEPNNTSMKSNHDGCEGCMHLDKEEWEEPCSKCKQNYIDYWRLKK